MVGAVGGSDFESDYSLETTPLSVVTLHESSAQNGLECICEEDHMDHRIRS
jgi:hypothetical protein